MVQITLKRKKLTIYHADGTEEVILSKATQNAWECGGITAIGYSINMDDNTQILVQPTLHRKIKIETVEA